MVKTNMNEQHLGVVYGTVIENESEPIVREEGQKFFEFTKFCRRNCLTWIFITVFGIILPIVTVRAVFKMIFEIDIEDDFVQ